MHMADALVSPAVGGALWTVSTAAIAYSSHKVSASVNDRKVPLMGVLGAFLFAAQMINFTIPATGSSGHLGGGLLLAILLGPHAAFLSIASVLVVQALFFADGGLLALGCNIINLGAIPAFLVYPLVYTKIAGINPGRKRLLGAAMISAIVGLQLGSFAVVLETVVSDISALPFSTFVMLMQPIHLAIGVVEGFVTALIVTFIVSSRPEVLLSAEENRSIFSISYRGMLLAFLVCALLLGGIGSRFASKNPDGLEWTISKITGNTELEGNRHGMHGVLADLQEMTALLPDYSFRKAETSAPVAGLSAVSPVAMETRNSADSKRRDDSTLGSSVSGILGAVLTLGLVLLFGLIIKKGNYSV